MKKTGPDPEAASVENARKDKRPLVLFLFGLLVLATSAMPLEPELPLPAYGIAAVPDGRWHHVRPEQSPGASQATGRAVVVFPQTPKRLPDGSELREGSVPAELALFFNRPLPINQCQQQDLEMLPGIGPRLASAILETKRHKGRFAGPEDLLAVPGIGPNNVQRLLPLISFEP